MVSFIPGEVSISCEWLAGWVLKTASAFLIKNILVPTGHEQQEDSGSARQDWSVFMGSDIKELTEEAVAQISLNHLWHCRIHCVVTVQ